ncbi:cupin domain-containing protein [Microlunatus sp. Gsoil 973]|uniref:cupin domain-containing protein n=1 Tax=Microlunatus sp. Gsoil 973 TaxID=2672569 RepID=UPI0012B4CCF9|nr:cupin domain-containing protein [Microlunatus sp. Gsoil 973]QGN34937.1 cupin domain-containing protein [Microlunatus sp. Gsoil 973]
MPAANRMTTEVAIDIAPVEGRYRDLGKFTVGFETYKQDLDPAPYFGGLPDDRCPCEHWGIVTAGRITFRWPDRMETYTEGDAYYAPPGHLPLVTAGTSVVEFSTTEELSELMSVLEKNLHDAAVI